MIPHHIAGQFVKFAMCGEDLSHTPVTEAYQYLTAFLPSPGLLFLCLFIYLFICLFMYIFIYIDIFTHDSICMYVCLYIILVINILQLK